MTYELAEFGTNQPEGLDVSHAYARFRRGVRLERTQVAGLAIYHALALLAFVPWFFSWTGVLLAVLGIYVFGVLGINIGYHRLLTHKGFVCPKWLERGFALLGVCCLQGSPSRWVATHRRHHEHADDEPDPHSPILGFLWAHVGWVLVKNETMERGGLYRNYAKDILRDDFYAWIEDRKMWIWLVFMSWGIFFFGGLFGRPGARMAAGGGGAICLEPVAMGRDRAHRRALSFHLGGQFGHPSVGLSQLRHG